MLDAVEGKLEVGPRLLGCFEYASEIEPVAKQGLSWMGMVLTLEIILQKVVSRIWIGGVV
jgi:hypothetical protein